MRVYRNGPISCQIRGEAEGAIGERKERSTVKAAEEVGHGFCHRHRDSDGARTCFDQPDPEIDGVTIGDQKAASPFLHTPPRNAWKMRLEVRAKYGSAATSSLS